MTTIKQVCTAYANGARCGDDNSRIEHLHINMGGELTSYSTPIIRRDMGTRSFQVIGLQAYSTTTRRHISCAREVLLANGWTELTPQAKR